ncbi:hypothetical protein REPUB_Repub04eG0216000 [Reevesia pubescens]
MESQYFGHEHPLAFSEDQSNHSEADQCSRCGEVMAGPSFSCAECEFYLHKKCAEAPSQIDHPFHRDHPLCLLPNPPATAAYGGSFFCHFCGEDGYNFRCRYCVYVCNGFGYKCDKCAKWICLRCIAPDTLTCEGHEHPLAFYWKYEGQCNGCGEKITQAYNCKECNFPLCMNCPILPLTIRHKCDEHLLALTYHDDNTYSKSHFCDICEEDRNPSHWFYSCAICDTSVHRECALGRYPFMKSGRIIEIENHPHSVALVKKMYYYPKCFVCGDPCRDLAVECIESGCEYIAHWECVLPSSFWEYSSAALPEK